ncbi:C39 family peptidase [Acetilactobacillus jinshanensis]|uniref:Uncharacterized protein n=1 Tax=Acetilactobacillus jinshanensis TaxID=1720083 RepID=A0A4P6ZM06_9LACO|nr:C39 family peptidase [Acetilactobacillus jinshanensis]QBP18905.1 hypothetical protein ELX58_07370 [Acetilactobacillus jinshanensis]URL60546.1 hypothetical protein HGK75_00425 [uncultured bacterium]
MFKSKQLIIFVATGALLTLGGVSATSYSHGNVMVNAASVQQQTQYQIQSASRRRLRVVKHDARLWQHPYNPGVKSVGNVDSLAGTNKVVHLNLEAKVDGKVRYYQIGRQGRTLGWIDAKDLAIPKVYMLPYRYVSQFWPSHADDACEAASLMMALSVKGKGMHTPLRNVVKRIPRSTNPQDGYTKDPFKLGTGASIYPRALAKVSRQQFHIRAKDITGASKKELIHDVTHGNPVVFAGSYKMRDTQSDHSLVLLGYRRGYFYFADPFSKRYGNVIDGWVSTSQFMKIFTAKKRGARALLVY